MQAIKRHVLVLLAAFILFHFPWRLAGLWMETCVVDRGYSEMSDGDDMYWPALNLEAKLIHMGWQVQYEPGLEIRGEAAYGMTIPEERLILIGARLHWNARYAVLAHEAGHVLSSGWTTRNQDEAFAEAVATLVAKDGLRQHARYMARFRADALIYLIAEWRSISRAAAFLED